MSKSKFKIIIRRTLIEDYEMILENESAMEAFDEANCLVNARNETSKIGRFSIVKIEREE